jgi:hypothetical protein
MSVSKGTSFLFALTLLVAGYFLISPARAAAQTSTDSEQVNSLLSEAKAEAHALEADADQMLQYSRSNLMFESHAQKINQIREHVNKTGQLLDELEAARESASPWQMKAIDEIRPLLQEIADNTEAAIGHLNDNPTNVHRKLPPYPSYLEENYKVAKELASLITDYVDYGKHKASLERLSERLSAPNQQEE